MQKIAQEVSSLLGTGMVYSVVLFLNELVPNLFKSELEIREEALQKEEAKKKKKEIKEIINENPPTKPIQKTVIDRTLDRLEEAQKKVYWIWICLIKQEESAQIRKEARIAQLKKLLDEENNGTQEIIQNDSKVWSQEV